MVSFGRKMKERGRMSQLCSHSASPFPTDGQLNTQCGLRVLHLDPLVIEVAANSS